MRKRLLRPSTPRRARRRPATEVRQRRRPLALAGGRSRSARRRGVRVTGEGRCARGALAVEQAAQQRCPPGGLWGTPVARDVALRVRRWRGGDEPERGPPGPRDNARDREPLSGRDSARERPGPREGGHSARAWEGQAEERGGSRWGGDEGSRWTDDRRRRPAEDTPPQRGQYGHGWGGRRGRRFRACLCGMAGWLDGGMLPCVPVRDGLALREGARHGALHPLCVAPRSGAAGCGVRRLSWAAGQLGEAAELGSWVWGEAAEPVWGECPAPAERTRPTGWARARAAAEPGRERSGPARAARETAAAAAAAWAVRLRGRRRGSRRRTLSASGRRTAPWRSRRRKRCGGEP